MANIENAIRPEGLNEYLSELSKQMTKDERSDLARALGYGSAHIVHGWQKRTATPSISMLPELARAIGQPVGHLLKMWLHDQAVAKNFDASELISTIRE